MRSSQATFVLFLGSIAFAAALLHLAMWVRPPKKTGKSQLLWVDWEIMELRIQRMGHLNISSVVLMAPWVKLQSCVLQTKSTQRTGNAANTQKSK